MKTNQRPRTKARLFLPKAWDCTNQVLRRRFIEVDAVLRVALALPQPTYADLAKFVYTPSLQPKIRVSVLNAVKKRTRLSYTMTQEVAAFTAALREPIRPSQNLHEIAQQIRRHLFGSTEPLRNFDMTISYHDWMRIPPPATCDPLFTKLDHHQAGPSLFCAINVYLIVLTAHPFSDGNGRTSRLLFNMLLAQAGAPSHYIPITELTRATRGLYEEYIGLASHHGNFRQLMWLLLSLFESYALFLTHLRTQTISENDIDRVARLAREARVGSPALGINETAPYPLAVTALSVGENSETKVEMQFVATVLEIARALHQHGEIDFAITSLADITRGDGYPTKTIAFFMKAVAREKLLMRFRELRTNFMEQVRIQVAISTGDPVLDAKMLVVISAQHARAADAALTSSIMLHDFSEALGARRVEACSALADSCAVD